MSLNNELNSYELSSAWFDFCFENPELISPNHTAIYFFAIEHCNRLGWKKKFGFPSQMTMDAIGIRKHSTYIRYFNDLVEWGFFKLIEKSKNQYSSNIICLSNALPKKGKALGKARSKHTAKHTAKQKEYKQTIEQEETIKPNKTGWRENFSIYKDELIIVYEKLINDDEFVQQQKKFHPNIDIKLSIEKAVVNFWATEAGWKHKKKSRAAKIDWKSTLTNAIDKNKVYEENRTNNGKGFKSDTTKRTIESIIRRADESG